MSLCDFSIENSQFYIVFHCIYIWLKLGVVNAAVKLSFTGHEKELIFATSTEQFLQELNFASISKWSLQWKNIWVSDYWVLKILTTSARFSFFYTAQKMKFSIKDFFSKCDRIRRKLQIWSNLLTKSLMENFIFFVQC